ncbi:MAG: ParB/RepB/Spo0J family partition protein [Solobacterium sp.]|nr:ParB/RepB/Spo0J family partition protein [Solobacterium sp.]
MSEKKNTKVLGKGLGNIFGTDNLENVINQIENNAISSSPTGKVEINVNEIRENPYQPRKEFDKTALEELAESIKTHGIFTPILVRKSIQGYNLVTGERRLRAAKMAGLTTVPAIVVEFTDEQMMEISILENIQREDLNPIEEAVAYDALIKKHGYTQEKLAERLGKSREYCANMMRLLKLPEAVQDLVVNKKLTMGHVRPLLSLNDENEIFEAAEYVLKNKLSVREVEEYIRSLQGKEKKVMKKVTKQKDPWIRDIENHMQRKLGTEVDISKKAISIHYTNTEDLNRILEIIDCLDESEEE